MPVLLTRPLGSNNLPDVTSPKDGISLLETQWDKSENEGLISMDRSSELLYHLQYPVLLLSRLQRI